MIKYYYTIEQMMQIIADFNKREKIIAEFKEEEGVDTISEEELTDLFGTTFFDENVYWYPRHWYGNRVYTYLTDYEQYELDCGYDTIQGEFVDELIRQENEPWIELYESLDNLEDIYPCKVIDVDDFTFELISELKSRIDQLRTQSHQNDNRDNSATTLKYENWISILKYIDGVITPQELDVLAECISTYASVCGPYERRKEISRNMCYQNSWFDIDLLEFESKIYRIDVQILFELTEILLELDNCFFCTTNSDSYPHSSSGKHDWPISTFYYCWEILAFDSIQWYEMQTEISWLTNGLIQYIWEADHVVFIMDEFNGVSSEYDYYINQFNDSDQQNDEIELGDFECLSEDDLFMDTWLVAGMKLQNHIDYFWLAEITDLCQTEAGDFYTDSRDDISEQGYCNYSKYLCYNGDSGFKYCNKESCDGCKRSCTEIKINQQYVLWEKYVQPIEMDEYFVA